MKPPPAAAAAAKRPPRRVFSPIVIVGCGIALIAGGGLMSWMEMEVQRAAQAAEEQRAAADRAAALSLKRTREREAKARAEQERLAAEEAAERARRASLIADAATEAQARRQRDEIAQRKVEVQKTRQSAEDSEEAWKRYFRPSERCRDPAAATAVECVNEYIKARREFQAHNGHSGQP
jgi:hypothetical protein